MEIIGYFFLFLYGYIVYYFSKDFLNFVNEYNTKTKLVFLLGLFVPGILVLYAMSDEKYIYFYDYSNYWMKAIEYNNIIERDGLKTFSHIYSSINKELYNDLIVLPITLLCKTLGFEFRYFTFAIYLIYAIPIGLIYSNIFYKIIQKKSKFLLFLPFIILIMVPLILPIRFGFVDIAGLVVFGIILVLMVRSNPTDKIDYKRFIFIGILLLAFLFTRRYFTFVFISFFIVNFIVFLGKSILSKNYKPLLNGSINLAIAGLTTLIFMAVFFYPFFEMTFLTNYRDIYSGYRKLTWEGHFDNFTLRLGYITFPLLLAGIWGYYKSKKYEILAYLVISLVLIYFTFVQFNDFGPQHYYVIMPFIILLISGIFLIETKTKFNYILIIILGLFSTTFIYNVLSEKKPPFNKLLVTSKMNKLKRADYDELEKIVNRIKTNYDNGHNTYVVSNSPILNFSILNNFDLPKAFKITPGFIQTQDVDKRDKFPNELFLADYVIVTNPTQLHLNPESQQIVVYFNQMIRDGKFKDHFIVEEEYKLDNNVKAFMLKKIKGFSENEIEETRNHFKNLYPDYPNMYDVKDHYLRLKSVRNGDNYGNVKFEGNNISIHPGVDRNSEITFELDSLKTYQLKFKASFRDKENIVKNCNPDSDAEVFLYIYKNDELQSKSYITHKKDSIFDITIQNANSIKILVDKGKHHDWCDWFFLENFELK